jgi:hypothetical protein
MFDRATSFHEPESGRGRCRVCRVATSECEADPRSCADYEREKSGDGVGESPSVRSPARLFDERLGVGVLWRLWRGGDDHERMKLL